MQQTPPTTSFLQQLTFDNHHTSFKTTESAPNHQASEVVDNNSKSGNPSSTLNAASLLDSQKTTVDSPFNPQLTPTPTAETPCTITTPTASTPRIDSDEDEDDDEEEEETVYKLFLTNYLRNEEANIDEDEEHAEDDEDYNYTEDEIVSDKEEYRSDPAVQISQKELSFLLRDYQQLQQQLVIPGFTTAPSTPSSFSSSSSSAATATASSSASSSSILTNSQQPLSLHSATSSLMSQPFQPSTPAASSFPIPAIALTGPSSVAIIPPQSSVPVTKRGRKPRQQRQTFAYSTVNLKPIRPNFDGTTPAPTTAIAQAIPIPATATAPIVAAPAGIMPVAATIQPTVAAAAAVAALPPTINRGLTVPQLRQLYSQICDHVQLLIQVYALCLRDKNHDNGLDSVAMDCLTLLRDLKQKRDGSLQMKRRYNEIYMENINQQRQQQQQVQQSQQATDRGRLTRSKAPAAPVPSQSIKPPLVVDTIYNVGALELLENFVIQGQSISQQQLRNNFPQETRKLMQPFLSRNFFNASLLEQFDAEKVKVGRLKFTKAEDRLLAMGLKRYGTSNWTMVRQFFLPTKTEAQLVNRYKNMSSTRAPNDNPIKQYKQAKKQPLTEQEKQTLREGIQLYGYQWDLIAKSLLPHRKPSMLKKFWCESTGNTADPSKTAQPSASGSNFATAETNSKRKLEMEYGAQKRQKTGAEQQASSSMLINSGDYSGLVPPLHPHPSTLRPRSNTVQQLGDVFHSPTETHSPSGIPVHAHPSSRGVPMQNLQMLQQVFAQVPTRKEEDISFEVEDLDSDDEQEHEYQTPTSFDLQTNAMSSTAFFAKNAQGQHTSRTTGGKHPSNFQQASKMQAAQLHMPDENHIVFEEEDIDYADDDDDEEDEEDAKSDGGDHHISQSHQVLSASDSFQSNLAVPRFYIPAGLNTPPIPEVKWTRFDDKHILTVTERYGASWETFQLLSSQYLPNRTPQQIAIRFNELITSKLPRFPVGGETAT